MMRKLWKSMRRKTTEKQCFSCKGVGLERDMRHLVREEALFRKDILNNRGNAHVYSMHICKVCQGNGVYEVMEHD